MIWDYITLMRRHCNVDTVLLCIVAVAPSSLFASRDAWIYL